MKPEEEVKALKKLIRMRRHTLHRNKALRSQGKLHAELNWLQIHVQAHEAAWKRKGATQFIKRNYERIKFIAPGNRAGDALINNLL